MPRAWLTRLLFALALALQVIAPMSGGVAAARDGVKSHALETCLALAGGDHGQRQGGHGHTHGHHDCALCQAFCDGVAPVAGRPASLGRAPVQWEDIHWMVADRALPAPPRNYDRQARAPPKFS